MQTAPSADESPVAEVVPPASSPDLVTRLRATLWPAEPMERAYRLGLLLIVALGFFLRSNRYWFDPIGIWGDEALWGARLFTRDVSQLLIRPVGFMAVTKVIVHVFCDERTLRILPYLGGMASVVQIWDVSRQLSLGRLATLLSVFVIAIHPVLIDLTKEFKPYELELSAHLALLELYLRYENTRARRWLVLLALACPLVFLFAYNIAFLLPGLFVLVVSLLLGAKAFRRLALAGAGALLALAVMFSVYHGSVNRLQMSKVSAYWGRKYDVFYMEAAQLARNPPVTRTRWLADKYSDIAEFPGWQRERWKLPRALGERRSELMQVDRFGWLTLHALGIGALVTRRRFRTLVLLLSPLLVTGVFNVLGFWPFGGFRTNTFLMACVMPLAGCGVEALGALRGRLGPAFGSVAAAFVLLPNLLFAWNWHSTKSAFTFNSEMPTVLERLKALRDTENLGSGRIPVLLDWYSCDPGPFYAKYHDGIRRKYGKYFVEKLDLRCAGTATQIGRRMNALRRQRFFVVISDNRNKAAVFNLAKRRTKILRRETVRGTQDLYLLEGS